MYLWWGLSLNPTGGAYSAPPNPLAGGEGLAAPYPRSPRSRPLASNFGPSGLRSPPPKDMGSVSN